MSIGAIRSCFLLVMCLYILTAGVPAGAIHDAVLNGDLQKVKTLISGDRELLNALDEKGKAPLHYAIEFDYSEMGEYLIEQGADIDLVDKENQSPLHYAASTGNPKIAEILLTRGSTGLNESSTVKHGGAVGGWTPLHLACLKGHPELVSLLLDYGADIEARDEYQRTPLIITAQSENLRVAEILVEKGADINAVAIRNYTALLWAARNDFEDMVDFLLNKGAVIADNMLETAVWFAISKGLNRLYEYAEERGFNAADVRDKEPGLIVRAAEGGSVEIVTSLIQDGFDPAFAESDGWTALHYAASEGFTDVIKVLIETGADKNARNTLGESAFNMASSLGFAEVAAVLREAGADTSEPQFPVIEGPYMGQPPPGDKPEMFMPGIVSGHYRAHSSIIFSPDGKEAYWTEMKPPEGGVTYTKMVGNRWTYPQISKLDRDPSFSPDGKRIYFIKTRPFRKGEEPGGDPDVKEEYWYVEKTDEGWSEPISTGDAVNAIGVHWPCSIDKDGNLYFSEFSEKMYFSQYRNGEYQTPISLKEHFKNETLEGCSPFISPDGDYLIFSNPGGLNVSFKKKDNTWSDAINIGPEINASNVNGSPRVTADGQYLFFVSAGRDRPWGIYWVSADIIDRLKTEHLGGE